MHGDLLPGRPQKRGEELNPLLKLGRTETLSSVHKLSDSDGIYLLKQSLPPPSERYGEGPPVNRINLSANELP